MLVPVQAGSWLTGVGNTLGRFWTTLETGLCRSQRVVGRVRSWWLRPNTIWSKAWLMSVRLPCRYRHPRDCLFLLSLFTPFHTTELSQAALVWLCSHHSCLNRAGKDHVKMKILEPVRFWSAQWCEIVCLIPAPTLCLCIALLPLTASTSYKYIITGPANPPNLLEDLCPNSYWFWTKSVFTV